MARFAIGPAERAKHRIVLVSADSAEARRAKRVKPKAVFETPIGESEPLTQNEMLGLLDSNA